MNKEIETYCELQSQTTKLSEIIKNNLNELVRLNEKLWNIYRKNICSGDICVTPFLSEPFMEDMNKYINQLEKQEKGNSSCKN